MILLGLPLVIAIAILLARYVEPLARAGAATARVLETPRFALVIAIVSALIFWIAWGSLTNIPVVHDEASYLFQAKLFSLGKWTSPSPPMPEFFEQYHVFVVPHYASKYPPGHAILLVPGIWLGLPGLMPVILSAIAATLIFAIARRVFNAGVAFWTWLIWITAPFALWMMGSYYSQSTSTLMWMVGWYAIVRWRERDDGRWLLLLAASVAWLAFTRPLTAVAYALPIGVHALWRTTRTRQWVPLAKALALGSAMLLVIPLWSVKTTGALRPTPYALYSQMYFPWDAPGFGLDSTPPSRGLPPDMQWTAKYGAEPHRTYTPKVLPGVLLSRMFFVARDQWGPPRFALAPLALIGLLMLTPEVLFAIASALVLMIVYLWFGHGAEWTVYYAEIQPVLALVTALGLWRLLQWRAPSENRRTVSPRAAGASLILAAATLLVGYRIVGETRYRSANMRRYQGQFVSVLGLLPADKAIVFLRYAPWHNPHLSLLYNDPDLEHSKRWIVYDRGPVENAKLMKLAPDRKAYIYDEEHRMVGNYSPDGITPLAQTQPVAGSR